MLPFLTSRATSTNKRCSVPWPVIVFNFADLQVEMQHLLSIDPSTKFLIQGIHAAQIFSSRQELYDFHRFLSFCAKLAANGSLQPEYYNFMDHTSMIESGVVQDAMPCRPGSSTWVYHMPWWDHACRIITSTAAAQLLKVDP